MVDFVVGKVADKLLNLFPIGEGAGNVEVHTSIGVLGPIDNLHRRKGATLQVVALINLCGEELQEGVETIEHSCPIHTTHLHALGGDGEFVALGRKSQLTILADNNTSTHSEVVDGKILGHIGAHTLIHLESHIGAILKASLAEHHTAGCGYQAKTIGRREGHSHRGPQQESHTKAQCSTLHK
jgi:hypothetical protein